MTLETGDKIIVERDGTNYQMEALDLMTLDDNDLIIISRGGKNYKAKFEDIKGDLGGGGCEGIPPVPNPDALPVLPKPGEYRADLGGFACGTIWDGKASTPKRLLIAAPVEFVQNGTTLYGKSPNNLRFGNDNFDHPVAAGTDAKFNGRPATEEYGVNNPDTVWPASPNFFTWCVSDPEGPNAGVYDPTNTVGTGINGFNDWYIPGMYECTTGFMAMYWQSGDASLPSNLLPAGWPNANEGFGTVGCGTQQNNRYYYKISGSNTSAWNSLVTTPSKGTTNKVRAIRSITLE